MKFSPMSYHNESPFPFIEWLASSYQLARCVNSIRTLSRQKFSIDKISGMNSIAEPRYRSINIQLFSQSLLINIQIYAFI